MAGLLYVSFDFVLKRGAYGAGAYFLLFFLNSS